MTITYIVSTANTAPGAPKSTAGDIVDFDPAALHRIPRAR